MFKIIPGVIRSPKDDRDWQFAKVCTSSPSLPEIYIFPNLPKVKNQLNRGTCGGFAGTGCLELNEILENGSYTPLSDLALYLKTRVIDNEYLTPEEDGVMMRSLADTAVNYGAPFESLYRYRTDFKNIEVPPAVLSGNAYHHRLKGYVRCNTIEEIKKAIFQKMPVLIGLFLMSNIYQAQKGIVPFPCEGSLDFIGGHAMYVVGWDDKRKLLGFRNSWGLENNMVDGQGITWFPYDYVNMVTDFGMPMFLDAFALIDFVPDKSKLPKTVTLNQTPAFVLLDNKPVDISEYGGIIMIEGEGRMRLTLRGVAKLFNVDVDYHEPSNTALLTTRNQSLQSPSLVQPTQTQHKLKTRLPSLISKIKAMFRRNNNA